MNKDRIEGFAKQAKGKLKEAAGKLMGNEKTKQEGRAEQLEGKIQNTAGGVKDKIRDVMSED